MSAAPCPGGASSSSTQVLSPSVEMEPAPAAAAAEEASTAAAPELEGGASATPEQTLVNVLSSLSEYLKHANPTAYAAQRQVVEALKHARTAVTNGEPAESAAVAEAAAAATTTASIETTVDSGQDLPAYEDANGRTKYQLLGQMLSVERSGRKRDLERFMSAQNKLAKLIKHNRDKGYEVLDDVEILGGGDGGQDAVEGPGPVHPEVADDNGLVADDELPYRLRQCRVPVTTENKQTFFPAVNCHFPHSLEPYKRAPVTDCHAHIIKLRGIRLEFRLFDREDRNRYVDENDLLVDEPNPVVDYEVAVEYADDYSRASLDGIPKAQDLYECVTSPPLHEVNRNLTMNRGRVCVRFTSFNLLSSQTNPLHRKFCFVVRPKKDSLRAFPQLTTRSAAFYVTSKSNIDGAGGLPAGRLRGGSGGRGKGRGRGRS